MTRAKGIAIRQSILRKLRERGTARGGRESGCVGKGMVGHGTATVRNK